MRSHRHMDTRWWRWLAGGMAGAQIVAGLGLSPAGMAMDGWVAQQISSPTRYVLGAGDRLNVEFFNIPEYTDQYQVLSDGTLHLPQAGTIAVEGLTLDQATQAITARYAQVLRRPIISLNLLQARPVTVAIAGEISRPGSYTLAAASPDSPSTLTQVLQQAGGVTQSADVRRIQIRRVSDRTLGTESVTINLWDLIQAGDIRQDLTLRDGDSIVIPTATTVNPEESRRLAAANFAADATQPIQVAVVGEVNRPGPHTLRLNTNLTSSNDGLEALTVSQAIRVAGGITQLADIRDIQVRRVTHTGQEQVIPVDFWELLMAGNLQQDLPLQNGDTIVVPTATALTSAELAELASASFAADSMTVYVVGEVSAPGAIALPPSTSLNQAILAAGGFNNRARRSRVELVRLNPDGTILQESIDVDLSETLNAADNPSLRPGDTVLVGRSGLASFSDTLGLLLSPVTGVASLLRLLGL
ncbi:MAG: SLBB domain-containing protein [Synechococcales cyanobacterium K44_A2020_017]|nr:SLBB domain-containing protein [Synechococcales cyanobacterium K44_A2020_017]